LAEAWPRSTVKLIIPLPAGVSVDVSARLFAETLRGSEICQCPAPGAALRALTKAQHGEDDPQYALALTNLAGLLQATNRLAEAEPLFRGALAIDEKRLGSDNPDAGP